MLPERNIHSNGGQSCDNATALLDEPGNAPALV
jgi:hypothetical protein